MELSSGLSALVFPNQINKKRKAEINQYERKERKNPKSRLMQEEKNDIVRVISYQLGIRGLLQTQLLLTDELVVGVAANFGVCVQTVRNVWKSFLSDIKVEKIVPTGRPCKLSYELEKNIKQAHVEHNYSTNYRQLSLILQEKGFIVPKSSLNRYMNLMNYHRGNARVAPLVSTKNRIQRLLYVLSKIEELPDGTFRFKDESNIIVIDEKWFDFRRATEKIKKRKCDPYVSAGTAPSKDHIQKLMFLAAIGRPQIKSNGEYFDGKIFLEPFTVLEATKRKSKNRAAGVPEIKPQVVNAETFQEMVLKTNGLLDVIAEKTRGMNARIIVQQDNAKPHTGLKNREIINEVSVSRGMNIEFMNQPPQSPDLNRLDLCFFHSLSKQRELIRRRCNTNEELIEVCSAAFNDYSDAKLRRVYALQFVVYREVLKHIMDMVDLKFLIRI